MFRATMNHHQNALLLKQNRPGYSYKPEEQDMASTKPATSVAHPAAAASASAPISGGVEETVTPEFLFWNAVLLLGFDVASNTEKFKSKFEAAMFRQPNVKAMEVVFYFLFTKLDPKDAGEVWGFCGSCSI
jgi:hypothetical protein